MHSSKIEYVHVYVQEILCPLTRRFAVGKLDNQHWSFWLFFPPAPRGHPGPKLQGSEMGVWDLVLTMVHRAVLVNGV